MKFLVFLEHHEGKLQKDSLGVLGKAASLGEAEAVLLGSEVEGLAADAGRFGAQRVHVMDDVLLDKPLPQPRVDALETLRRRGRLRRRPVRGERALGRRRGRARGAPRRGPQLRPHGSRGGRRRARRQAPGARRLGLRRRRLELGAAARARPLGDVRAAGERRRARRCRSSSRACRTSRWRRRWSSRRTRRARGRRSRTPT